MANTANIKAVITADDKASATLKNFGDNVNAGAKKAAVALGVAGAALTLYAKNATDFTVEYVKNARQISRETGITVEESSRLIHVLNRVGVSADEASAVFGIFSKKIAATDESFEKLGISVKDQSGKTKTFNQILLETADKFQAMPDGIEKTALVLDLFGRSGKEMIKVLNLGSAGISELEAQADKLGLTLTATNINSIAAYIKSQKDLKDSTDALKIAIGETTAPVLTSFNNKVNEVLTSLLSTDGAVKTTTVSFLAFGGPVLAGAGALLGFAANLGTVLQTAEHLNAFLIGFGGFAVIAAAAIAAGVAIVYAGNQAKAAWDRTTDAIRKASDTNDATIRQLSALKKTGTPEQQARATKALQGLAEGGAFASGGYTGQGGQNEVAGIVHKGEYVLPQNQVNQSTGLPKSMGANVNININVGALMGNDVEARKFAQTIMKHYDTAMGRKTMVRA